MRFIPTQTQVRKTALMALGSSFIAMALAAAGSVWAGI